MNDKLERELKLKMTVYVVEDKYPTSASIVESGFVFEIDKKVKSFVVTFYHDDYRRYSFNELGKTVFFDKKGAESKLSDFNQI